MRNKPLDPQGGPEMGSVVGRVGHGIFCYEPGAKAAESASLCSWLGSSTIDA